MLDCHVRIKLFNLEDAVFQEAGVDVGHVEVFGVVVDFRVLKDGQLLEA